MVTMESPLHSPLRSPLHSAVVSKWGADAYAVLGFEPELVIDAVEDYYRANSAATTFADMFTFSRASGATYTDSSGVLQTAASGVARTAHHIYNGTSWVKAGLLVEPTAATNLVTYSQDFTNAAWTKSDVTIASGAETGPDGVSSLASVTISATTATHSIYTTATVSSGATVTQSYWVKAGTQRYVSLREVLDFSTWAAVTFDLQTGTITATQTAAATVNEKTIENFGSGLYRISMTSTVTGRTLAFNVLEAVNSATPTRAGFGIVSYLGASEVFYAGFAQLEAGSVPSSYIPTSGSTATRAAETVTIAAAKLPYSATAMSIQMEGYFTYADLGAAAQFVPLRWYLDANNFITIDVDTDSTATGEINFNQSASGTADTVASSATAYAPGVNVAFNIASRHGATFINGAVDGTALTEDATPTALPALSSTNLALGYSGGPIIISKFRMWGADIGDAGIEEASA